MSKKRPSGSFFKQQNKKKKLEESAKSCMWLDSLFRKSTSQTLEVETATADNQKEIETEKLNQETVLNFDKDFSSHDNFGVGSPNSVCLYEPEFERAHANLEAAPTECNNSFSTDNGNLEGSDVSSHVTSSVYLDNSSCVVSFDSSSFSACANACTNEDNPSKDEIRSISNSFDIVELVEKSIRGDSEIYSCLKYHYVPTREELKQSAQNIYSGSRKGKQLLFQLQWLEDFHWLVYSPTLKGGFCKFCVLFAASPKHYSKEKLGVFVKQTFKNFKKAKGKCGLLNVHESTKYHQDACISAQNFITNFVTPQNRIDNRLEALEKEQYENNMHILKTIIDIIILSGKQCISLRGDHDDKINFSQDADRNEGNFIALLRHKAKKDPILAKHLCESGRNQRYTSKTIQNQIIECVQLVLRDQLLKQFSEDKNTFYTVIADEVTDTSANREILCVCIRFVENVSELKIREIFLDFVNLERTKGAEIAKKIVEVLENAGLNIKNIRGQAYDGASNMSSEREGVQGKIKELTNERAIYVHCSSHILNLAICQACKIPEISNMIGQINEVFLFLYKSPKKQRLFEKILSIVSPDMMKKKVKGLCKTRWVERHQCLESICQFLPSLMSFWREIFFPGSTIADDTRTTWSWDRDTKISAQGLYSYFEKFPNIVILITLRNVLDFVKPLSVKLQKCDIDIFQAYCIVDDVLQSLKDPREQIGNVFIQWWQQINDLAHTDPDIPCLASRQMLVQPVIPTGVLVKMYYVAKVTI